MLEKPDVQDERIIARLLDGYGLQIEGFTFLPLGADQDSAVYRAVAQERTYFVKLRRGTFDEVSVLLPRFLSDEGIEHLVPPQATLTGQLWADLDPFKLIVYPFVEGRDAYETPLSNENWRQLGTVLNRIHNVELAPTLVDRIPRETYPSRWREMARFYLGRTGDEADRDPIAAELAAFLHARRQVVTELIRRADLLAAALLSQSQDSVLCHADIHAGNILIEAGGDFYLVDWDGPILAPKERDLMSVGAGLMGAGHTPQEEETLFYEGYGQTLIDPVALTYYRYERIIVDIALFCQQINGAEGGREDREQALRYLMSNFQPGGTIDIARASDNTACHDPTR